MTGETPEADRNSASHFDEGKPRFDLIPHEAITALADHYRRGAVKYGDRNWLKGMEWMRLFGSLMRHAWRWAGGEDHDPETGSHHMIAVAWNAIGIYTYFTRGLGSDDRK
jgi:hypothetical protein